MCDVCYARNYRNVEEHLKFKPYCVNAAREYFKKTSKFPWQNNERKYYEYIVSLSDDKENEVTRLSRAKTLTLPYTQVDYCGVLAEVCRIHGVVLKMYIYEHVDTPAVGVHRIVKASQCVINSNVCIAIYSLAEKYLLAVSERVAVWFPASMPQKIKDVLSHACLRVRSPLDIFTNIEVRQDGSLVYNHFYSKYEVVVDFSKEYVGVLENTEEVLRIYCRPSEEVWQGRGTLVVNYDEYPDLVLFHSLFVELNVPWI